MDDQSSKHGQVTKRGGRRSDSRRENHDGVRAEKKGSERSYGQSNANSVSSSSWSMFNGQWSTSHGQYGISSSSSRSSSPTSHNSNSRRHKGDASKGNTGGGGDADDIEEEFSQGSLHKNGVEGMPVHCEDNASEEGNARLAKENEEMKKTLQRRGKVGYRGKNDRCKKGGLSNTDLLILQQMKKIAKHFLFQYCKFLPRK